MSDRTTHAPGKPIVLYDGACPICRRSVARLQRWVPDPAIEYRSFRSDGALDDLPGVRYEDCEVALHYVSPEGRVFAAVAAIVEVLSRRRLGRLARLYRIPGIKQLADVLYRFVARNRFTIGGDGHCTDGTCALPSRPPRSGEDGASARK